MSILEEKVEKYGGVAEYTQAINEGKEDIDEVTEEVENVLGDPLVVSLIFLVVLILQKNK